MKQATKKTTQVSKLISFLLWIKPYRILLLKDGVTRCFYNELFGKTYVLVDSTDANGKEFSRWEERKLNKIEKKLQPITYLKRVLNLLIIITIFSLLIYSIYKLIK